MEPPKPAAAVSAQVMPAPQEQPEAEQLASFRGGGPTNESCATALLPEVASRTVEFHGRVTDPSGKGIPGAKLYLVTDAWSLPEQQTTSGNDGVFHFVKTVGDFGAISPGEDRRLRRSGPSSWPLTIPSARPG